MRHFKNHFNQITVICKISGSNLKSAESQSIAVCSLQYHLQLRKYFY